MISFKVILYGIRAWLLINSGKYKKCIILLREKIIWLEGLDDKRNIDCIVKDNLRIAKCYMKLGQSQYAIDYCYQATFTYTSTDEQLNKKALQLRADVLLALTKNKNIIYDQY